MGGRAGKEGGRKGGKKGGKEGGETTSAPSPISRNILFRENQS